jgi:tetratricopeptide (TPR) repeat protein
MTPLSNLIPFSRRVHDRAAGDARLNPVGRRLGKKGSWGHNSLMIWRRTLCGMLLAALWVVPAPADQQDRRLDRLFDRLQQTADQTEAAVIQHRIWQLWFQSDSDDVNKLMRAGQVAMGQGNYRDALEAFDRVVELAPDFAEGWNRRATLHYLMDNYDASVADVRRTLTLEPRHFGALSGLGLISIRLGYTDQAVEAFRRALDVNPHLPGAKANIESLLGQRI